MSPRARIALFCALVAPLVVASLYLLVFAGDSPPDRPAADEDAAAAQAAARAEAVVAEKQRDERREAAHAAGDAQAEHEPGPRAEDVALYEATQAVAEPVARRFFDAFARYELGELSAEVTDELAATATRDLAAELLDAPPRFPPGAPKPKPGELGALEFVPLEGDAAGEQIVEADLVGTVIRDGERSPVSLRMKLDGRWRVAAVDR